MITDTEALDRIVRNHHNEERALDYAFKQTDPRLDNQGRRMKRGASRATKMYVMDGPIRHLRAFVAPTRIGAKRAFMALAFPQYDPARLDDWSERDLTRVMGNKGYTCKEVTL